MKTVPTDIKILDRLTAVNLNVTIWTARKKLTPDDIGGVELPPEELASLGNKKICDPEKLRVFSALKARAVTCLGRIGVRFLGGWAIPEGETENIHEKLLEIKNDFMEAKEQFLGSYDLAIKSWVDRHPGWESLLASSTVSASQVRDRLNMNWQFYKVSASEASPVTNENLVSEVESLGQALFGEISSDARAIWSKVYAGKTEVSHRALSPLKTMRDKLVGLSFVEPRAAPVADLIETAIQALPKRGLITGGSLVTLQGLVSMLRDPELLLEHGQKLINGRTASEVLSGIKLQNDKNAGKFYYSDDPDDLDGLDAPDVQADIGEQDEFADKPLADKAKTDNRHFVDSLGLW
jgi:hypothetical protein